MFTLKHVHSFNWSKITIKYQYIQTCSMYQYPKSTTSLISTNKTFHIHSHRYSHHFSTFKPIYKHNTYIQPTTLYKHSKYNFTVIPLEEDGTLSLLQHGNKQIYLIGTAHISSKSADQVSKVINEIKPDTVFVELCPTRAAKMWAKIRENENKENKDLTPITSEEWLDELPHAKRFKEMNVKMLKFLESFGFVYGGEFQVALKEAENNNAKLVYGDRDVRETMKRMNDGMTQIWDNMSQGFTQTWKDTWNDTKQNLKMVDSNNKSNQNNKSGKWYEKSDDGKRETFGKRGGDNTWG
eukprot:84669_1